MSQTDCREQEDYNPPRVTDRTSTNSVAILAAAPYTAGPKLLSFPAPKVTVQPSTSKPETELSLLRQVMSRFSTELDSSMSEETVARIEEDYPEVPAEYDLATYEYDYEQD